VVPTGPETKNDCAGEDQQKFTGLDGQSRTLFRNSQVGNEPWKCLEVLSSYVAPNTSKTCHRCTGVLSINHESEVLTAVVMKGSYSGYNAA
jgi:hypothetical protein